MPQALRDAKPAALLRVTTRSLITDRVGRAPSIPTAAPSISLPVEDANKLASMCHLSDSFFSEEPKENVVIGTNMSLKGNIEVVRETVDVPNVIGWYPGSDPDLKDEHVGIGGHLDHLGTCLLYTSPSPRDKRQSRMPSSA